MSLLTAKQVADRLSVPRSTVYQLRAAGRLPAVNVAVSLTGRGKFRWREEVVAAFERDNEDKVREPVPQTRRYKLEHV